MSQKDFNKNPIGSPGGMEKDRNIFFDASPLVMDHANAFFIGTAKVMPMFPGSRVRKGLKNLFISHMASSDGLRPRLQTK